MVFIYHIASPLPVKILVCFQKKKESLNKNKKKTKIQSQKAGQKIGHYVKSNSFWFHFNYFHFVFRRTNTNSPRITTTPQPDVSKEAAVGAYQITGEIMLERPRNGVRRRYVSVEFDCPGRVNVSRM